MYKSNNPYESVIYQDGELLNKLKYNLIELERISVIDERHTPVDYFKKLLDDSQLIVNALKANGCSRQTYFE